MSSGAHDSAQRMIRLAARSTAGIDRQHGGEGTTLLVDLGSASTLPFHVEVCPSPRGLLLAIADPVDALDVNAGGHVASSIATYCLTKTMMEYSLTAGAAQVALQLAFHEAHTTVLDAAVLLGVGRMRTGMTAVHIAGSTARIAQVGDSQVYVLRETKLLRLTAGSDTGTAAERPTNAGNAIGMGLDLLVGLSSFDLRHEDIVLVASRGLTAPLSEGEIHWLVRGASCPRDAVDSLMALTMQRGAVGATVIVALVSEG